MLYKRLFYYLKLSLATIFIALTLAACSFTPAYQSNNKMGQTIKLEYPKPASRLEQIIFQNLQLTLGKADDAQSEQLDKFKLSLSQSTRTIGRSSNGLPSSVNEIILSADFSIIDGENGQTIYQAQRLARASYTTNGQIIADKKAQEEASERAALELAQIIRLTLIGALGKD